MPRFVEIEGSVVRYVLPVELANQYSVLVQNQVEIPLDADIVQGDIYEGGIFRHVTAAEIKIQARPAFNSQRNALFTETEWVRQRHQDRLELGIDDAVNWKAWLKYWQALRDMPQQLAFDASKPQWLDKPK